MSFIRALLAPLNEISVGVCIVRELELGSRGEMEGRISGEAVRIR